MTAGAWALSVAGALVVASAWILPGQIGAQQSVRVWTIRLLIPFVTAVIASAAFLLGSHLIVSLTVGMALSLGLAAAWTDLRTGQIADMHSYGIAVTGIIAAPCMLAPYPLMTSIGGAGIALFVLITSMVLTRKVAAGGRSIGLGDFGLAVAGGLWTGAYWTGPALLIAVVVTLLLQAVRGGKLRNARIPFAPGLVSGFAIATGLQVIFQ